MLFRSALNLPSSVTIPAGKKELTVSFTAGSVTKDTTVTVTAEYKGKKIIRTLKILSSKIDTLTFDQSTLKGGETVTCTVTIKGTITGTGLVIELKSSHTDLAPVPATITIPAGKTSGTFTIKTKAVTTPTTVAITAETGNVVVRPKFVLTP